MDQKMAQDEVVRDFVQNVLGCGCPEEVFRNIEVRQGPIDIGGIPISLTIQVGGRLLIFLTSSENLIILPDNLETLIRVGKKMRDKKELNRFRLVVASKESRADWEALRQVFHEIQDIDDRVHLHVIDYRILPPLQ